jgi:hypothetical protein
MFARQRLMYERRLAAMQSEMLEVRVYLWS